MLGIILNIAGLFTVSGLQVYAALRMTKVAEYIIQQNVSVFMSEVFIILGFLTIKQFIKKLLFKTYVMICVVICHMLHGI